MPPATIAAVSTALRIMKEEPHHVQRLQAIGTRMIAEFKRLGFNVGEAQTPIIPLIIGDDLLMFRFYRALIEHGVYANPVVAPAVPPGRGTHSHVLHGHPQRRRVGPGPGGMRHAGPSPGHYLNAPCGR